MSLLSSTSAALDVIPGIASLIAELDASNESWLQTKLEGLEKRYFTTLTIQDAEWDPRVREMLDEVDSAVIVQTVYSPATLSMRFGRTAEIDASLALEQETLAEIGIKVGIEVDDEGWLTWTAPVLGFHRYVALPMSADLDEGDRTAATRELQTRGIEAKAVGDVLLIEPGRNDVRVTAGLARKTLRAAALERNLERTELKLVTARRERDAFRTRVATAEQTAQVATTGLETQLLTVTNLQDRISRFDDRMDAVIAEHDAVSGEARELVGTVRASTAEMGQLIGRLRITADQRRALGESFQSVQADLRKLDALLGPSR